MYYIFLSSHYSKIKLKTKLKKAERVLDIGSAKLFAKYSVVWQCGYILSLLAI